MKRGRNGVKSERGTGTKGPLGSQTERERVWREDGWRNWVQK